MKYCVHGMGYSGTCGKLSTTRREGWPLCDEHAQVWDDYDAAQAAARLSKAADIDFVQFARETR